MASSSPEIVESLKVMKKTTEKCYNKKSVVAMSGHQMLGWKFL